MKKAILLLILTLSISGLYSQVPGYLGHRFVINYDFDLGPDLNGWYNFDFTGVRDSAISPQHLYHSRHNLSGTFVVSRRTAIGLSFGYSSAAHRTQGVTTETFSESDIPFSYLPSDFTDYFNPLSRYLRTNSFEFGGFYQIHTKSYIAPAGTFVQLKSNVVISKSDFYDPTNGFILVRPEPTSSYVSSLKFSVVYGHNHIFMDKFIFRYGYELGWDVGGFNSVIALGGFSPEPFLDGNYLGNQAKAQSFYSSWFLLKFGFGFIPPI